MSSYREAEGREILSLLYENPADPIAVDTETTGLKVAGGDSHMIGLSLAGVVGGKAVSHYFGVDHETGENVHYSTVNQLRFVLQQPRPLIFANVQFDILSIETGLEIQLDGSDFYDICTMANLINENQPINKGLDSLSQFYLHEAGKLVDPYVEAEKKSGNHNITPEQEYEYAKMDAESTFRVWLELIKKQNWKELPSSIWPDKQELIRVLLAMRRRGVLINVPLAKEQIAIGEAEMKRLARELGYPAVPKKPTKMYPNPDPDPLPVLGPIALEDLFINRLDMPVIKRGKKQKNGQPGKPSFDKEVMAEYDLILERLDNNDAKLVKAYRGWQKTVSAAYRPYVELLDSDGRLRCSYKTHGTVTGRLSCSEPNLQQIPKESDKLWNGKVKQCFVAAEGYTLINADFSQLELRLATAYAGEESLRQVFAEGRDIFDEMSIELDFDRQTTKTFVYSTQYGAGIKRIMSAFGVLRERAQQMLQKYAETYPRFRRFADYCASRAKKDGRVKIWSGRYRHFQYPDSEDYKAMNSVIQGGAADIMERVMCRVFRELDDEENCRMLLQVHDSITFEVKTEYVDYYTAEIKRVMEDVPGSIGADDFDVKWAVEVGPWTLAA